MMMMVVVVFWHENVDTSLHLNGHSGHDQGSHRNDDELIPQVSTLPFAIKMRARIKSLS